MASGPESWPSDRGPRIIIIVGGDDVSYGARLPDGETFRNKMLTEGGIRSICRGFTF
jgi:hypothetical protein